MNPIAEQFITSLKGQLDPRAQSLAHYITDKTYLRGKKLSFKGREYQAFLTKLIEDNPGCTFVWKKSSQIGLSELANRIVLARMALRPGEGVLVSFPSKTFSQEVIKTRISNVIAESPALLALQDRSVDSASCKQFVNGSILYGLSGNKTGASGSSSLLNRPISTQLIDETDRQDPKVYTGFHSRMTATAAIDRLVILVSTPTAPGIGIDAEFKECRIQYTSLLKCNNCLHDFDPDYYADIHIPGYTESLTALTKLKAATLDLSRAYLECPECGEHLDSGNTRVVYRKNINEKGVKKKIGVSLSPFAALSFISIQDLVESSLTYTSHVEFLNQGLGKTANIKDSSVSPDCIKFFPDAPDGYRIAAMDMGKICTFMSGVVRRDTTIHVDKIEFVKLSKVEDFIADFLKSNPTVCMVMDQAPYADLVYRLVKIHPRLFSAVYKDPITQPPEIYTLKMQDKHGELVRQVTIMKNKMMDLMTSALKDFVTFQPSEHNTTIMSHMTSMRKVRDYRFQEVIYKWVKPTSGEDHVFHTMLYLFTASKLAYANFSHSAVSVGSTNLMSTIKVKIDV